VQREAVDREWSRLAGCNPPKIQPDTVLFRNFAANYREILEVRLSGYFQNLGVALDQ
jgi:hypothetical protein